MPETPAFAAPKERGRAAARPCYERALAINEAVLGPQHPHSKIVRGNLAALVARLEAASDDA